MFCHVEPQQVSRDSVFMSVVFCFWLPLGLPATFRRLACFTVPDRRLLPGTHAVGSVVFWTHLTSLWSLLSRSLYSLLQPCCMVSSSPLAWLSPTHFHSSGLSLDTVLSEKFYLSDHLPLRPQGGSFLGDLCVWVQVVGLLYCPCTRVCVSVHVCLYAQT